MVRLFKVILMPSRFYENAFSFFLWVERSFLFCVSFLGSGVRSWKWSDFGKRFQQISIKKPQEIEDRKSKSKREIDSFVVRPSVCLSFNKKERESKQPYTESASDTDLRNIIHQLTMKTTPQEVIDVISKLDSSDQGKFSLFQVK